MKALETQHPLVETGLSNVPLPDLSLPSPRLRQPQRLQVEIHCLALDDLLEPTHPARAVWETVSTLDLDAWLKDIQAVEGQPGRDATDPRLLVALWVYATLDGAGNMDLNWNPAFTLQQAPSVDGPWTDVVGSPAPPHAIALPATGQMFYRVR